MTKKQKISYEIDPHNRLIARKTGTASGVRGYRHLLDGKFKIDKSNSLTYHIKKSSNSDIPQQMKLSGDYSLDKDRNLVLTLNKWNNQVQGNKLIIKGRLLDAKDDELSFTVGTRDSAGNGTVYILKLSGTWHADEYNRLSFNVKREKGAVDNLSLEGAWKVNKRLGLLFEIPYEDREVQAIVFGAACKLTGKDTIEFKLKNRCGEDIGASLKLSRKILKDQGEAYIQALKEGKELSLLAGVGFRW